MHRNRLLNLFASNAKRGEFRAEGDTLYIYDVIVSSKAEAEWYGGVDAETFVKALAAMTGDVHIRINSPGGDVFAGVAIAAAIAAYPGNILVHIDGYAASAASVVAVAAGNIEMAPGAFMMIHKAWTFAYGNADDLMSMASLLEKIDGSLADSYAAAAGARGKDTTAATFAAAMTAETWLTPSEAIALGLADTIAAAAPKAAAKGPVWDLSAYSKAPAPAADTTTVTVIVTIEDDDNAEDPALDPEPADSAAPDAALAVAARVRAHAARMLGA